ncbi:MAG: transposase [Flavobacteriales bacterium Tduv]
MEKEIRKIYQKGQGIKVQPAYSGISLFNTLLLSNWYDLSDVEMEKLLKTSISLHDLFWFSIGRSDPRSYDSMQISQ